ncbi:MAG: T9SS type A sorting domain-containing protein [Calditrichaeota bacterium]|nr:T9SS type A sorting domain-containing protein [Calditrichota bacterium]
MRSSVLVLAALVMFTLSSQAQTTFGDTLYSFNAGALTPTRDQTLLGLTFAQGYFWVTGMNAPQYDHRLYKIHPNGDSLVSYTSLGTGYHAYYDLAYDGRFLYVTDRDSLIEIDPQTGLRTGNGIGTDFGYLLVKGVAYDPGNDHFWVIPQRNGQQQIIYEIDRAGNTINTYPNPDSDYTTSLTWDTLTPGGPFLWTFSREEEGYNSRGVMRQFSPAIGRFTGVEMEMVNRSEIIVDSPLGITFTDELPGGQASLVALQSGALNVYDGLDWVVVYDASGPGGGATINVTPSSIQAQVNQGDSIEVPVYIGNLGQAHLTWEAYAENADSAAMPSGILGDTLFSINLMRVLGDSTFRSNSIAYARDHFWVSGYSAAPGGTGALYKIDRNGVLVDSYPVYGSSGRGWRTIASDGDFIFATDTYSIAVWSIDSARVVNNVITGSISQRSLAYDPNNRHFYLGALNGAIEVIDFSGNTVRFMTTPYPIEGLAWDHFSPGGPFLWAWTETGDSGMVRCEAIQLNPQTGIATGRRFSGVNPGTGTSFPEAVTLVRDVASNRLILAGLQEEGQFPVTEAFIVGYDLAANLPPVWVQLSGATLGTLSPAGEDTLMVRLHGLMGDTTTAAVIRIRNNDLSQPLVEIPVTLAMLSSPLTGLENPTPATARSFWLEQNYPNPFNPSTTIGFYLPRDGNINLRVYDALGREVRELVNGFRPAGRYSVRFDATELPSGIYFYRLGAGNGIEFTRRMLLVK